MKEVSKIKYLETLKSIDYRKCYGLFYELKLKINIKCMIVINIDVSDGLVNGTTGMLKQINLDSNNVLNEIIWFDFHLDKIGHKTRIKLKNVYPIEVSNGWTPIKRYSADLSGKIGFKGQLIRIQFPIIPAEATTIHKSQGSTYKKVCVDLNGRFNKAMLYVSLSRVTNINNLYILGNIRKKKKFSSNSEYDEELNNLKTKKRLVLKYTYEKTENVIKIIYLNINSLSTKYQYIETTDVKYGQALPLKSVTDTPTGSSKRSAESSFISKIQKFKI